MNLQCFCDVGCSGRHVGGHSGPPQDPYFNCQHTVIHRGFALRRMMEVTISVFCVGSGDANIKRQRTYRFCVFCVLCCCENLKRQLVGGFSPLFFSIYVWEIFGENPRVIGTSEACLWKPKKADSRGFSPLCFVLLGNKKRHVVLCFCVCTLRFLRFAWILGKTRV